MTKPNQDKQLENHRQALEQKAAQVREALKTEYQGAAKEDSDNEDDRVLAGERSLGLLVMDRDLEVLEEIHAALARMSQDEYGLCQICEDPINPRRLDAIPWTRRCLSCQEAADSGEATPPGQRRRKRAA
jgi:DnaK suppressor protein